MDKMVPALLFLSCACAAQAQEAPMKAYSKFDFVPGSRIVASEDFTAEAIGDFPATWNTNASGEIVTVEGKPGHWLMLTKGGVFVPEVLAALPDDLTLEFDLLASVPFSGSNQGAFGVSLAQLQNPKAPEAWQMADNRFTLMAHPNGGYGSGWTSAEPRQNGVGVAATTVENKQFEFKSANPVHVSIWRQKQRVRVYFNQEKLWDLPRAMTPAVTYNAIVFYVREIAPDMQYYLGNLRLAVGAPDTRSKLVTEGRWVTHGILFDVNSDAIKGVSYGTLKEIAGVLKENPDLKVRIVGHTDADGEDAKNLDLSKRRAAAVKSALVSEFGIADGRLETDGKGETQPADTNDTAAGKANNRRVEFLKL
jgi:outer membrane protein OmpA-like peptidoglycan-associated protein